MKVNSIKSGALWSMGGQFVNIVIGFLVLVLTTRFLGPEQYGLLQTILTLIILASMVSDFGFSSSVARYIAENQNKLDRKSEYMFNGLILKLISSSVVIFLIINMLPFFENILGVELEQYSTLLIIMTLLRSFREYLSKVMQGLRRLDLSTKLNIFYNLGNALLVALLLYLGLNIEAVLISEITVTIFYLLIFVFVNKKLRLFIIQKIDKNIITSILKYALPMFFITMSFYLYMKVDTLMVQYFRDSLAVGFYSLATMIIGKVHTPMVAIGQATGPALVSLSKNEKSERLVEVLKNTFILTLPICIGVFLISEELITVLFGESYLPALSVLQLMTIFLFFYSLNSVLTPVLDYLGFARARAIIVGISATINAVLNIFFIPEFGIIGAAYSTLLTYSIYSLVIISTSFYHILNKNAYKKVILVFFKILLISMIMGIAVFLGKQIIEIDLLRLITSILIGISIYAYLAITFNILNKKEINNFFRKK